MGRAYLVLALVSALVSARAHAEDAPSVPAGYEGLPQSAVPPPAYLVPPPPSPPPAPYAPQQTYVVLAAPPAAPPPEPEGVSRSGFALELGAGLAFTSFLESSRSLFGMSLLDFSIGGYVSPRVAMFAHMQSIALFGNEGDSVNAGAFAHLSFLTEVWITDRLGVGGLLGIGAGGASDADSFGGGFVVGGRVMYDLAQSRHHSLTAVYQLVGAWTFPTLAMTLGLEWQYH